MAVGLYSAGCMPAQVKEAHDITPSAIQKSDAKNEVRESGGAIAIDPFMIASAMQAYLNSREYQARSIDRCLESLDKISTMMKDYLRSAERIDWEDLKDTLRDADKPLGYQKTIPKSGK